MFGKKQIIQNANISDSTVIQINGATVDSSLIKTLQESTGNTKLLNKLVRDNLEYCKNEINSRNFGNCKKVIDTIFNYGLIGIETGVKQELYFIRFLILFVNNDMSGCDDCIDILYDEYKDEAKKCIHILSDCTTAQEQLLSINPEAQVCVLNRLFNEGKYDCIGAIYNKRNVTEIIDLENNWDFYYSLVLFNNGDYEKSSLLLCRLKENTGTPYNTLLYLISEVFRLKSCIDENDVINDLKCVYKLFIELLDNNPNIMKENENLLISTNLSTALFLDDKLFIDEYEKLSDEKKNYDSVKVFYSVYCEYRGEYEKALEVNLSIEHIEQLVIQHRFICYKELQHWDDIIECYKRYCLSENLAIFDSFYISALKHTDKDLYETELSKVCKRYQDDYESLYYISEAIKDYSSDFNKYILPLILNNINKIKQSSSQWIKFGYCGLLLHNHEGNLCLQILLAIENLSVINISLIHKFCKDLFDSSRISPEIKEKIADCFILENLEKENFVRLKINALYKQKKYVETISLSEELYDITEEDNAARNIIEITNNFFPEKLSKYKKYLQVLELSNIPSNLMVVASAYSTIGRIEEADRNAYNALLMLNNKVDYDILSRYIILVLKNEYEHKDKCINHNEVKANSAVFLKGVDEIKVVCLENLNDNGLELGGSYAIESLHVYYTDPLYHKLFGKSIGKEVEIDGKQYIIENIIDKYTYAFRYSIEMIDRNPKKDSMPIKMLNATDGEDFIKQIRAILPEPDSRHELLKSYHMEDQELGLPIESITGGNYDDYLDVVKFLLYAENQALYAGENTEIEKLEDSLIVVSLSTVVVLNELNALSLLEPFKNSIYIPESLILFLQNRIDHMHKTLEISPGKMCNSADGELSMIPHDKSMLDAWDNILNYCIEFHQEKIEDKEISDFPFIEGMSAESFFNNMNLDRSQLECMILAKKSNAIYLSDDLFYRKIANLMGIQNSSLTCLINDKNCRVNVTEFIKRISKTNYIYIPYKRIDSGSVREIANNLIKGKYKQKYYGQVFENIQIMLANDFFRINDKPDKNMPDNK